MFRLVEGTNVVGEDVICPTGALKNVPAYEYSDAFGEAPLTLENTVKAPFGGMHVYGRSEQFTTTGAQLLNTQGTGNSRGVDWVFDKGVVTFSGVTVDTSVNRVHCVVNMKDAMEIGKTYFAKSFTVGVAIDIAVEKPSGVIYARKYTPDGTETDIRIRVLVDKSTDAGMEVDLTAYVAITENERLSSWEPYTGGKPSPSPEYPQEIVSVGESGNITVEVRGRNLLTGRLYFTNYSYSIPYVYNEDEVALPYAPSSETHGIGYVVPCKPGVQYTFSVTNPNKNWYLGIAEYENFEQAKSFLNKIGFQQVAEKSSIKYTAVGNGVLVCAIAGKWTDGKTTTHECTESELLQLEIGSEATTYEPYRTPQILTLQTPNGLPGVPVSKDGNYTDADGQQWVCDEVDLGRGKYVQRIKKSLVLLKKTSHENPDGYRYISYDVKDMHRKHTENLSDKFRYNKGAANTSGDITIRGIRVSPDFNAIVAFEKSVLPSELIETTVYYVLATPIERDLTPEEIAAYSQLTANDGTTVIDIEDENIPTYVSATYPVIPAYGKMEGNTLRVSKVQSEGFKPILTDSTTYAEARDSVFIGYMDRPDSIARVYGANPLDERTE